MAQRFVVGEDVEFPSFHIMTKMGNSPKNRKELAIESGVFRYVSDIFL